MNFRQLYSSSTSQERHETIEQILHIIEARQHRWVFVRGRLVRDRRGYFRGAHFLHDRRVIRVTLPHPSQRVGGMVVMASVFNLGVWMFALPYAPHIAAPIVTFHLISLSLLFAFHPMPRAASSAALQQGMLAGSTQ